MSPYSEVRAHVYVVGQPIRVRADDALRLVLDEGWAPYASAEFTIPYTPARHAALDPHDAPRVVVRVARHWHGAYTLDELSEVFPAGFTLDDFTGSELDGLTLDDLTPVFGWEWEAGWRSPDVVTADLGVRGRRTDYAAATIAVRAASDELIVQDARVQTSRPVESLHARILAVLALVGLDSPRHAFDAGAAFTALAADVLDYDRDPWSYLVEWCSGGGVRLWCDEQRVWRTAWADDPPTGPVTLTGVKAATDDTDRDGDWCDAIVWLGKGTNSGGEPITEVRTWPSPLPPGPIRVHTERVDYGQQGAGLPMPTYDELALRLARLQSQDRVMDVVAVIDPTLRPGMALDTGAPSLPALSTVASRVVFEVPADEVTITTRSTTEA